MKIQHLAIIFIIIIVPISFAMSEYIQTQIDTIKLQTEYKEALNSATSAALKAFQINSINNKYSNISDSKIRDIEASINTFYNSLTTSMTQYVSSKSELSVFVPAIVFNLYDGYYIYSSYNNVYTAPNGDNTVKIDDNAKNYQDGLHPYIYYSCKYNIKDNGEEKEIIVNYTLDNAITVYGKFNGKYQTKSGYLINYKNVNVDTEKKKVTYDGVEIGPETLKEHLLIVNDNGEVESKDYEYIVYKNRKVYKENGTNGSNGTDDKYFWYNNGKKTYLQGEKENFIKYINDNKVGFQSISAYEYYKDAYDFSKWLVEESGLVNIKQENMEDSLKKDFSANTGTKSIFDITQKDNDPMVSSSVFNEHRIAVIRKSIETNLTTAIANYNSQSGSTYEFVMPKIDEVSWYSIENNVSIISFMQGMPIGQKYFNDYSVITNTKNEEVINSQSVYVVTQNTNKKDVNYGNYEYHQPGCKVLIKNSYNNTITGVYTNLSFSRQTLKVSEDSYRYFYPQARIGKTTTGCYNCIVNASGDYNIDDIISGSVKYKDKDIDEVKLYNLRKSYLTGLARERYDLYKSNF